MIFISKMLKVICKLVAFIAFTSVSTANIVNEARRPNVIIMHVENLVTNESSALIDF